MTKQFLTVSLLRWKQWEKCYLLKKTKGNILELLNFVYMILAPFIPNTRSNSKNYLFNGCLWRTHCFQGTVLGTGDRALNSTNTALILATQHNSCQRIKRYTTCGILYSLSNASRYIISFSWHSISMSKWVRNWSSERNKCVLCSRSHS